MLADEFLPKIEECVQCANGKIRADVAHGKLRSTDYVASERITRRAVVSVRSAYRLGSHRDPSAVDD